MQDCSISSASAMEILQPSTKPLIGLTPTDLGDTEGIFQRRGPDDCFPAAHLDQIQELAETTAPRPRVHTLKFTK